MSNEYQSSRDWGQSLVNPTEDYRTRPPVSQTVDWLGLALELEAQAKVVESKSAMRAMYSAARGLRLMGGEK
jgi:hypothetical protein